MTQIHPDYIPLEALVAQSTHVLVVRPLDPPTRTERVSILPPGSTFAGRNEPPYDDDPGEFDPTAGPRLDRNYPPYGRIWERFAVVAVLKPDGDDLAGTEIEVCEANTGLHRSVHEAYYIHGIGESPIVPSYRPTAPPEGGAERLAFLQHADGRWAFSVAGAVEGTACRDAVARLIAAPPR